MKLSKREIERIAVQLYSLATPAELVTECDRSDECTESDPVEPHGVIVRTTGAGVLFGFLESVEGDTVVLTGARQIWSWDTRGQTEKTLCWADLAVITTVPPGKFSAAVPRCRVNGVHSVADCTVAATRLWVSAPAFK